ncbi:MAG: response regulator [Vicinamibacterales bacterium]
MQKPNNRRKRSLATPRDSSTDPRLDHTASRPGAARHRVRAVRRGTRPLEPKRARVLVVDDESAFRLALTLILQLDDRSVVVARDGDEALAVMQVFEPDLVVMDWRMPGLSGLQLCAAIRRHDPVVPIVVVSSADEAFEEPAPVNARLRKPVDVERLRHVIAQELGRDQASPA